MEYIPAKNILSGYTDSNTWFGSNYNMNIYKGCNHGCIYCDSRSECYRIENFDEVKVKENAIEVLEKNLISKRKQGIIGMGAMSDPYNSFEKKLLLTRQSLELLDKYKFGVTIATKSDLVVRDIDVLKRIKQYSPVIVKLTITTCDDELCKKVEQNVCPSSKRFSAIKKLSENDIFAGILMMPILPFIEDNEENIIGIVRGAHNADTKFIFPAFGMTLRQNQRHWYYYKLDKLFPGLKQKYIDRYKDRYSCGAPNHQKLYEVFRKECNKYDIKFKMGDIIKESRKGYNTEQISFL